MEIYNYHQDYFYYIGSSQADESPLEPGVFLIPAHATTDPPPSTPEFGKINVFVDNKWKTIIDKRGEYYSLDEFNLGRVVVNEDPSKVPENTTDKEPPERTPDTDLIWNIEKEDWELVPCEKLTPEEKLAAVGLSVDDLKVLLGL